MTQENERFFEELSGAKATADEHYDVELAKANASVLSSAKPKMIHREEEAWADNEPEGQLTVDVFQTPNEIIVESAIAGVRPDDIDVNVTTDSISIRGNRRREKSVRDEDYIYQECYWGKFGRSIILPQEVEPDGADVAFKNGILTVRLPKANKKKTRKLKVRVE
jgi:HSP20 family protein